MFRMVINTKQKGFEWQSINSSKKYWHILLNITNQSSTSKGYVEPMVACFNLLLEQPEIIKILEEEPGKAMELLSHLTKYKRDKCIDILFNTVNTLGIKMDLKKSNDTGSGSNALVEAIRKGQSDIAKILIKSGLFDINGKDLTKRDAPILECIRTSVGFERDNQLECDNGLIFTYLLQRLSELDLTVTTRNENFDVIRLCCMKNKVEFIELMKQKIQEMSENGVENTWGLDETTIENKIVKYETYDELVKLANNNKIEIKKVETIFKERDKEILREVLVLPDHSGQTIWHVVCGAGNLKLLKFLINNVSKEECKMSLNMKSNRKKLPFHYACGYNRSGIVRYLSIL